MPTRPAPPGGSRHAGPARLTRCPGCCFGCWQGVAGGNSCGNTFVFCKFLPPATLGAGALAALDPLPIFLLFRDVGSPLWFASFIQPRTLRVVGSGKIGRVCAPCTRVPHRPPPGRARGSPVPSLWRRSGKSLPPHCGCRCGLCVFGDDGLVASLSEALTVDRSQPSPPYHGRSLRQGRTLWRLHLASGLRP